MSVKSVLHKIVDDLNRPHLHDEIEESDEQTAAKNQPVASELDSLKAAVAALQANKEVTSDAQE
jgi:hypothetical protein